MQSSDRSDLSPAHGATSSRTAGISNGVPTVSVKMQRILLATDLTPASAVATDWAFALAEQEGAELLIVSVIDPHELWLENQRFAVRWDQVRDRRQAAAQELVARGRPKGLDVTFLVWTGDPGESIVSVAEAEAADLIVVGTHGRGSIGRLFLGSVSEHVVRHAPCPVLVARPGNAVRPRSV